MPVGNPLVQATVAPSGQSIILITKDGEGNNTNITSLASSSEVESIRLTSSPSGNAFALTFGGQTTAPIPVLTSPPAEYILWTFPTIVGHSYTLAATWNHAGASQFNFVTLESGAVVANFLTTGTPPADVGGSFTDAGVFLNDGSTLASWETITKSNITASATSMQVRLAASTDGPLRMGGLRVDDITAETITYYNCTESANVSIFPTDGNWVLNNTFEFHAYEWLVNPGAGIADLYTINPGGSTAALVLQNALQALSSIGSGNLTVIDNSAGGDGNYQVTFGGFLKNVPQALITCGDSAVTITQVTEGGSLIPTLTVNGGDPIFLPNWIYDELSPSPYVYFPLPQSSPAVQTAISGALPCQPITEWITGIPNGATLSKLQVFGYSEGLTMVFNFTLLAPAKYQFAITYSTNSQSYTGFTLQPYTAVQFLVLDILGNNLATYSVNQTVAPSDYSDQGVEWKILGSFTTTEPLATLTLVMNTVGIPALSDGTQQAATLDAVELKRTSSDTSVVLTEEDTLVLTIQGDWITTAAGMVPGGTPALTFTPTLPAFSATAKTMLAGMNTESVDSFYNYVTHSNLVYLTNLWTARGAINSDGYPTTLSKNYDGGANQFFQITSENFSSPAADPIQGTFVVPAGKYILTWTGATVCALTGGNWTSATPLEVPTPSNVSGNWAVYDIAFSDQTAGAIFNLSITSTTIDEADESGNTYLIDLANLQIYPPDPSDPTGNTIWGLNTETNIWTTPPKFHPWLLYKLQGMQSLRFLGQTNANNNACSQLAHYKPVTNVNRVSSTKVNYYIPVTKIQAVTGSPYFFLYAGASIFQITTAVPHGLFDGGLVNFSNCGTAEFSGGGTVNLTDQNAVQCVIHVVDEYNIICYTGLGPDVGNNMTNVLTPGAGNLVLNNYGSIWPLQDMTDLIAAVGCTDMWFNMSITTDTTPEGGAYQIMTELLSLVPPGIKIHVECGNEAWNFIGNVYVWCELQQAILENVQTGSSEIWYANQCKAIHNQCVAAATAAGRLSDLVRIVGTQAGNPGTTGTILSQLQTIGAEFEELAVAPYFSIWPAAGYSSNQVSIFDQMSIDQLLDYQELTSVYGGWAENLVANQIPVLATYGYSDVKIVGYEGSTSALVPFDSDPNYAVRQLAVKHHPRQYAILLQMAQGFQDGGLTHWEYFDVGGQSQVPCWGLYESGNMQRGTGNSTTDAINITDPGNKNVVLSELGGGWHYWSTLSAPKTTTTTNPSVPGRNGQIRAIGYPRGMYRTTRHH